MNTFQRRFMKRPAVMVALLGTMTLFAGCTVGPGYDAPQAFAAQWRPGQSPSATLVEGSADLQRWWTRLNDPLLEALVNEAAAKNLDVATATARVREARAVMHQAGGALHPSLSTSGGFTRSGAGTDAVTTRGTTSSNTTSLGASGPMNLFQAGFDASWEIDLFGAKRRALESARDGYDAVQWDRRTTLLTLVADVTTRYVQARGYQARVALARQTAASQQETARLTQLRYTAGATSSLDAANASGEALSTLAAIPELEADYARTVHSLSVLLGDAPDALFERMDVPSPVPAPALPVARGVPAGTLLARPDVRAAERRYAQYTARVGQAEAERYPRIALIGSLSTSGTRFGELARQSTIGWSIGPSVTIPLFDAGRLKAAVEIADAQREQYLIAYRAAVLTALTDVENASVSLARETERTQNLQRAANAYGEAAKLAHERYQSGSTSFLEVLTADRSLHSAQDSLIQSRVRVTTDYIALNKALGGGWDGDSAPSAEGQRRSPSQSRDTRVFQRRIVVDSEP